MMGRILSSQIASVIGKGEVTGNAKDVRNSDVFEATEHVLNDRP